jgi:hypothetical protein
MFKLYIDESGKNTLTNILPYAPHFSVAGVIVHELNDDFIRRRADQIKFKYWGTTKITFHATDMRQFKGDFSIFKQNPHLYTEFCNDFKDFIKCSSFKLLWVGTNKLTFLSKNSPINYAVKNKFSKTITTHEKKLTQNTFEELWKIYLCYLTSSKRKDSHGKIIIEAADKNQDVDILYAYNKIMSSGIPSMNLTRKQVREKLTSISFVTKNNLDTETQLADIGSHFLNLDARINESIPYGGITQFDTEIIQLLKQKTFFAKCNGGSQSSCQLMI